MVSINIELNSKANRYGTYRLILRITLDNRHVRTNLDYSVPKTDFNRKAKGHQYIRKSNPDSETINKYLLDTMNAANIAMSKVLEENPYASAKDILKAIKGQSLTDFFDFANQLVEEMKLLNIGNYKRNKTVVTKFRVYVGDGKKLPFDSLTPTLFDQYRNYLASELKNNQNTIDSNFRNLKAILSKARKRDLFPDGASVIRTKTPKTKPERSRLTNEEIVRIQNLTIRTDRLLHDVRNGFLFSIYCGGIRVGDMLRLTWAQVSGDRLEYHMQKTHKTVAFPISGPAMAILNEYRPTESEPEKLVFPFLIDSFHKLSPEDQFAEISSKTAIYNRYLGTLAGKADITKHISSHTARHTFADLARQGDADLYSISKALGHSSLSITEKYIKGFDQDAVDEVVNIVNQGIFDKKEQDRAKDAQPTESK
jgi:integrase